MNVIARAHNRSASAVAQIAGSVLAGAAAVLAGQVLLGLGAYLPATARAAGPLAQGAYVWQRAWTDDVRRAVSRAGAVPGGDAPLSSLVVLAAEVAWESDGARIARVPLDYAALRMCGLRVGLALRVGPLPVPAAPDRAAPLRGDPIDVLVPLARELVQAATAAGLRVVELQVDFDCAAGRLDEYRAWLKALRPALTPVPLVITALPSWLGQREFRALAAAADGFVLQVHSLERPEGPDAPLTLCNPGAARRAVERAARAGVPFRVALPTYGYVVAFGRDGRLLGLRAEGPSAEWPPDIQLRTLRADPHSLAALVRTWTTDRPELLAGVLWYRLPTEADTLNWSSATFEEVRAGRDPVARLDLRVQHSADGLVEVALTNTGTADAIPPDEIGLRWPAGRLVAGDGLGGYELEPASANSAGLRRVPATATVQWLPPGARRVVGWLRFETDTEVRIDVAATKP